MKKWLSEPLVHFMLLGGLIFAAYAQYAAPGGARGEILVSRGQQENLRDSFARTWQRPPTAAEYEELLADYVRQEIAYRESLKLGLDEDDVIIRRRLRQKLELLAEDVASLEAPTEAELQAYLDAHPDDFHIEPRLSLRHVYFSPDVRGESVRADALTLLERIQTDGPEGGFEDFGDPLAVPARLLDMREGELERMFGHSFTTGLAGMETGRWGGPVESNYGVHLVFIERREGGRAPELAEVWEAVRREWFAQRRRAAVESLYQRLADDYTIHIEAPDAPAAVGGR